MVKEKKSKKPTLKKASPIKSKPSLEARIKRLEDDIAVLTLQMQLQAPVGPTHVSVTLPLSGFLSKTFYEPGVVPEKDLEFMDPEYLVEEK